MSLRSPQSSEPIKASHPGETDRAWTSLIEANRLLLMAEEMACVGHWQFDQITGLGHFSDEARRIFGFDGRRALTREPVLAAYHPDDRARVTALLASHVAAGSHFEYPARILRPDGDLREVLVRGRCDRDTAGTSVATFGTVLDVTDIRRTERRLEETGRLLTTTLDAMDQGLLMVDACGIVQVCNARAVELLDLPAEMMREKPSFDAVLRDQNGLNDLSKSGRASELCTMENSDETRTQTREYERPNGTVLEVRTVRLADGSSVHTYTDITERKCNERRIAHMARHDGLTNLPNRTLFHARLGQRLDEIGRCGGACAVLCLDLDRFKSINDTFGHLAGDAMLREVAERLQSVVDVEDTVARLGGDEFAVLISYVKDKKAATSLAARLISAVQAPLLLGGQLVEVGLSVGIALAPDDGMEGETIFRRADLALYQAKADGRGVSRVFELSIDDQAASRRSMEHDLRRAISAHGLSLHYQPQIKTVTGAVVGFEVLARWTHPVLGSVSPSIFIALAEETGLIVPLGDWVLRTACQEAAGWRHPLRIAVNLSARQFSEIDLPERVLAILTETGLSPTRLELEVTESVFIGDMSRALIILRRLKAIGIHISMDDFGTGYSSLATLQAFPFDKIKIDRSFVSGMDTNPQAAAIVRAVLGLGRSLGMGVVAEGVETANQLHFLVKAACDEVQGYLIGRPAPISTFAAIVHQQPRRPRSPAARRKIA